MITVERSPTSRAALRRRAPAGRTRRVRPDDGVLPRRSPVADARAARAENDLVVVSLFVNPLQFGPTEDLAGVPARPRGRRRGRRGRGRRRAVRAAVEEMYPARRPRPPCTSPASPTGCAARAGPTHFDGVTTVVAKLFSIVGPCRAYFGRKDAQQLAVVRRMAADLDLPVEVVGCPLVREPDGLAMSSRNAYLTDEERAAATVLSRALFVASDAVVGGERDAGGGPSARSSTRIAAEPRSGSTTSRSSTPTTLDAGRRARAARCSLASPRSSGTARLIDNVDDHRVNDRTSSADLGVLAHALSGAAVHRIMMKSKIHRATVTGADLNYVGSITLDPSLMELADIREHEQVHVLDIDNGARFETYVIKGGPGDVILNGAAARLVHPGDKVIVITYAEYEEAELEDYEPLVVHVDERNRPHAIRHSSDPRASRRTGESGRVLAGRGIWLRSCDADVPATDVLVLGSGVRGPARPRSHAAARRPVGHRAHQGRAGVGRATRTRQGGVPPRSTRRKSTRPSCTAPTRSTAGAGLCDVDAVARAGHRGPGVRPRADGARRRLRPRRRRRRARARPRGRSLGRPDRPRGRRRDRRRDRARARRRRRTRPRPRSTSAGWSSTCSSRAAAPSVRARSTPPVACGSSAPATRSSRPAAPGSASR